jgi:hypothetical protein
MGTLRPRTGIGTRMLAYILRAAAERSVGLFLPGASPEIRGLADVLGFRAVSQLVYMRWAAGYPRYVLPCDVTAVLSMAEKRLAVSG